MDTPPWREPWLSFFQNLPGLAAYQIGLQSPNQEAYLLVRPAYEFPYNRLIALLAISLFLLVHPHLCI